MEQNYDTLYRVISTVITETCCTTSPFAGKGRSEQMKNLDDEKILIPVKYPEYSDNLVTMATFDA